MVPCAHAIAAIRLITLGHSELFQRAPKSRQLDDQRGTQRVDAGGQ
jgi:hypothetical protein